MNPETTRCSPPASACLAPLPCRTGQAREVRDAAGLKIGGLRGSALHPQMGSYSANVDLKVRSVAVLSAST